MLIRYNVQHANIGAFKYLSSQISTLFGHKNVTHTPRCANELR